MSQPPALAVVVIRLTRRQVDKYGVPDPDACRRLFWDELAGRRPGPVRVELHLGPVTAWPMPDWPERVACPVSSILHELREALAGSPAAVQFKGPQAISTAWADCWNGARP